MQIIFVPSTTSYYVVEVILDYTLHFVLCSAIDTIPGDGLEDAVHGGAFNISWPQNPLSFAKGIRLSVSLAKPFLVRPDSKTKYSSNIIPLVTCAYVVDQGPQRQKVFTVALQIVSWP